MAAEASRTRREDWLTVAGLVHPIPSLVTTVATAGFGLLFGLSVLSLRFWLMAVAMLLAQCSISAANDWADWMHDAAARRSRPVPLGMIEPRTALAVAIGCGLAAIGLALLLGPLAGAVAIIGIAAGWSYDLVARATPLSALPFALAFPLLPVWAGVVGGRFPRSILVVFLAGAPLAVAIHLADAIPDIESDLRRGVRTLAVSLGAGRAKAVAGGALLLGGLVFAVTGARLAAILIGLPLLGSGLYWRTGNKWMLIATAGIEALLWFG